MMGESRKGILAVSFGTSCDETRKKTIDQIEEDMRRRYPDRPVYRAWTSGVIREKLQKRDGVHIMGVGEALSQMAADGITEVLVQPTFVISGMEYEQMRKEVRDRRNLFSRVLAGTPLLAMQEDRTRMLQIIIQELLPQKNEALVLMGHGSEHHANSVYASLDSQFGKMGYPNIFLGTVEGTPYFGSVMKKVKKFHPDHVVLAPFMIVAGNHALNDLAGEGEDSWKSRFEAEGFSVSCILRGLGEYEEVRNLLIDHMEMADEI